MAIAKKTPVKRKRATPVKRKTTPTTRRRKPAAKKGILSEFVTANEAKASFKAIMSGAIGVVPAIAIEKIAVNANPSLQGMYMIGAGFAIASLGKAPNAGAGCAAVGVYKILQETGMLNDNANYANPLQNMPMTLSEGEMDYLEQNGDYLQDDGYGVGYYQDAGGFGGVGDF